MTIGELNNTRIVNGVTTDYAGNPVAAQPTLAAYRKAWQAFEAHQATPAWLDHAQQHRYTGVTTSAGLGW